MPNETTAECPDCGVEMRGANDGVTRCPYCNSWAFRDAISDGAIYSAASQTTAETPADTQWACHLLAALKKRDNIDRVIQEYARAGFSGTKHDIDHRKMRDDVANSIIALWDEKREAADGKA